MRDTLLFLQLPQLDNDVSDAHENLYLAAACLGWAVRQAPVGRMIEVARMPPAFDRLGDSAWLREIEARRPRFLAFTAFLWNIERTLTLMRRVRDILPDSMLLLGGPEMARPHPFALTARAADAVTVGEGEILLPRLLQAFKSGRAADFSSVAWKTARGYRWGRQPVPELDLTRGLPPPDWPGFAPDAHGMAYLETIRGCPLHCAYCRYHHLRRRISLLAPDAIAARVRALRERGAREIRFVDPTFNAHPRFTDLLRALVRVNRDGKIAFFAELRADRLTPGQADLLAAARFTEIEAGVQSLDPGVLRAVNRPTDPARLAAGIRLLADRGIGVSLDLMIGLPRQTRALAEQALDWALRFPARVRVQCLHTLLLPGSDLRRRAAALGLRADPRPPYAVRETPWMTPDDFLALDERLARTPRLATDPATARFVGRSLPDLFPDPRVIRLPADAAVTPDPEFAREAWIFRGRNLYAQASVLARFMRTALERAPHALWQFVLEPETEEPLDLLDALIPILREAPPLVMDRYPAAWLRGKTAARRLFVRLRPGRTFDPDWIAEADATLRKAFY